MLFVRYIPVVAISLADEHVPKTRMAFDASISSYSSFSESVEVNTDATEIEAQTQVIDEHKFDVNSVWILKMMTE